MALASSLGFLSVELASSGLGWHSCCTRLKSRIAIGHPWGIFYPYLVLRRRTSRASIWPHPHVATPVPQTMDRVTLLAMELTNEGHVVPADVLRAALRRSNLTVVGTVVAVIPPSEEPPAPWAPWAPSAPPGLTSDLTSDCWSVIEDQEVQLLPAQWLQSGTCEVWHGKDAAGRDLWAYHLSCAEPGCRVAAMTHVTYGSTPVDEATKAGWTKHKTHGWRGASCQAHRGR